MSYRHYAWAWDQPARGSAQHVLLYLAKTANTKGVCWPGIATIAEATGLSPATVKRRLADLETDDSIERQARFRKDGTRTSDKITLVCLPGITVSPGQDPHDTRDHPDPWSTTRAHPGETRAQSDTRDGYHSDPARSTPEEALQGSTPDIGRALALDDVEKRSGRAAVDATIAELNSRRPKAQP
jgi:GntR family transcriptional regulator